MATVGDCLIAKGVEKALEAIGLIKEGCDNQAIMEKTKLDLKSIEKLRKKVLE